MTYGGGGGCMKPTHSSMQALEGLHWRVLEDPIASRRIAGIP